MSAVNGAVVLLAVLGIALWALQVIADSPTETEARMGGEQ